MNYKADLVPKGTFVHNYMTFMAEQETASAYDFWCALWLLSAAVGRRAIVARPRAPVFLNLYCVLVAESGITRKSSAVRSASSIMRELVADDPRIGIIENKVSASRLDHILHDRTMDTGCGQVAITISEMATFLGNGVSTGMPALLTDLYDCPASRRGGGTITGGMIAQKDVWLSFISASTPTWLFRSINPTIIEGGFTSRCLFVVSEKPKARIAWPSDKATDHSTFVQRLRQVREQATEYKTIVLNESALKEYKAWYGRRTLHHDPFMASFEAREDAHVLRLAALLCINDGAWVVQKHHVVVATRIVDDLKHTANALFVSANSRGKWLLGIEAVRNVLLMADEPTPKHALFMKARSKLSHAEFTALLDTMHESGYVQMFERVHDGPGRPMLLYSATHLLKAKGVIEQIAQTVN